MTFEDLESWQQARHLTRETYILTRKGEIARDFGLCGQIQRAAGKRERRGGRGMEEGREESGERRRNL